MHGDGRVAALALCTALVTACTTGSGPRSDTSSNNEAQERPNVLIVVTDDQPVGTMPVMPETQRYFSDEGVTFTRAYSTTPACCPARASIMTGMYAHNTGVLTNEDADKLDQDSTLQAHLRPAGYRTGMVGKFLNLWTGPPPHFDRWALKLGSRRERYFDTSWVVNGADKQTVPGYWTEPFVGYVDSFLNEWEVDDDEPWFLWLAISAPHAPYLSESQYEDVPVPEWENAGSASEADKTDKPPYVQAAAASRAMGAEARERQLRTLMSADDTVADVMTTLDDLDEDNTLAFFVSDNGYLWAHHGLLGTYLSKGNPYSGSVTVPMMMRWPGELDEGTSDDRLVGLLDIAPTVYDATGVDGPPVMDGHSLLGKWDREWILNEFWQKKGHHRSTVPDWTGLRTHDFSYVEYTVGGEIVFREYYDLRADPLELDNLLGDSDTDNDPDIDELRRRLETARTCAGAACP